MDFMIEIAKELFEWSIHTRRAIDAESRIGFLIGITTTIVEVVFP